MCEFYCESLEELLDESVDITSTSSLSCLWVLMATLPCPPTPPMLMFTNSPDGCHANWFDIDAGGSVFIHIFIRLVGLRKNHNDIQVSFRQIIF